VLGLTTGNPNSQDSPQFGLGGSHHLPPYNILCCYPRGPHPNGFFAPGLPSGSSEFAKVGILAILGPHKFAVQTSDGDEV